MLLIQAFTTDHIIAAGQQCHINRIVVSFKTPHGIPGPVRVNRNADYLVGPQPIRQKIAAKEGVYFIIARIIDARFNSAF